MDEAKVDLSAAGYLPCSLSASHVQLAVSFANGFIVETLKSRQQLGGKKKENIQSGFKFFLLQIQRGEVLIEQISCTC